MVATGVVRKEPSSFEKPNGDTVSYTKLLLVNEESGEAVEVSRGRLTLANGMRVTVRVVPSLAGRPPIEVIACEPV